MLNAFSFQVGDVMATGVAGSGLGARFGQVRLDDDGRFIKLCLNGEGTILHGQAVVVKDALAAESPGTVTAASAASGIQQVIVGVADLSIAGSAAVGEGFYAVVAGEATFKTRDTTIVVGDAVTVDASGFAAEADAVGDNANYVIVGKALSANAAYATNTAASGLTVHINGLL